MRHKLRCFAIAMLLFVSPAEAAISCDGVDDILTAAALSNFITNTTSTVMVWFTSAGTEPTSTDCASSNSRNIVVSDDGASYMHYVVQKDSNEVCAGNYDGTHDHASIPYAGSGTTSHIAFTHSGGTLTAYHNGVLITSFASGTTFSVANAVKVCDGRGQPANGIVHHVALFNTLVPAAEIMIQALSKRPRLRRTAATAEWLFDNCAVGASGNTIAFRDLSGNARTITGAAGAGGTGLTCQGHRILSFGGGIQ